MGETAVFAIRKLRDEQIPDSKGVKLPKDAQLGQFSWNTIFGLPFATFANGSWRTH